MFSCQAVEHILWCILVMFISNLLKLTETDALRVLSFYECHALEGDTSRKAFEFWKFLSWKKLACCLLLLGVSQCLAVLVAICQSLIQNSGSMV